MAVATISPVRPEVEIAPGYRGLLAFPEVIGEPLEPHERRIAREHFGPEREVYAILPRGNLKKTLVAKIGLHHLLVTPARILFERMRGLRAAPVAR